MKITRQTDDQLVFQDSTYWLAGVFAAFALLMACVMVKSGTPRGFIGVGFLLLFAFAWLRRSTVVFDVSQRVVRWTRVRWGRPSSGSLPFSEIADIVTQSSSGPNGVTIYRLALVANGRTIPFCDEYSGGGAARYEAMREAALKVSGETAPKRGKDSDALDTSIRSLLQQGRTADAIALVRDSDRLSLSAATQRVLQIRDNMTAAVTR